MLGYNNLVRHSGNRHYIHLRFTLLLSSFGQAVVAGVVPSSRRFLPSIFIAHRVQQSHCSSSFHRLLLTHALTVYAQSKCVHKKKSPPFFTSTTSGGFELTKLTDTRLEDNLIRQQGEWNIRLQTVNLSCVGLFHNHHQRNEPDQSQPSPCILV